MNSYEFEVICKNALINQLKVLYNEDFTVKDLHLVWFARELQNYKCTICDLADNVRYYECTYNGDKDELYIDIYEKSYNITIPYTDFSTIVQLEESDKNE